MGGLTRDRENSYFPVQLTTSRIGNHNRWIHTLLEVLTMHTLVTRVFLRFCYSTVLYSAYSGYTVALFVDATPLSIIVSMIVALSIAESGRKGREGDESARKHQIQPGCVE